MNRNSYRLHTLRCILRVLLNHSSSSSYIRYTIKRLKHDHERWRQLKLRRWINKLEYIYIYIYIYVYIYKRHVLPNLVSLERERSYEASTSERDKRIKKQHTTMKDTTLKVKWVVIVLSSQLEEWRRNEKKNSF